MKKIKEFDEKFFLDQLGFDVSKNHYEQSIQKLNKLCINKPFKTQSFVKAFEEAWCMKILDLLNKNDLKEAGQRMRSIYLFVRYNKTFNQLLKIYFEKIIKNDDHKFLSGLDGIIYFSMQSQYYFQNKEYDKANKSVKSCFTEIEKVFKKKLDNSNIWIIIQKSLKNIKDKKVGEEFLNQILTNIEK